MIPLMGGFIFDITSKQIMDSHMHEHGALYTSVPFVMFDDHCARCARRGGKHALKHSQMTTMSQGKLSQNLCIVVF